MPEYQEIYAEHGSRYDELVSREDYQRNILPALQEIRVMDGLDVVDLGAGTGRIACLLAPLVKWRLGRPLRSRRCWPNSWPATSWRTC